jgi:tRNA 2-thiocytidine biosynthesis protein TtcA
MASGPKHIEKIRRKVTQTLYKHKMLQQGDKVLVALSGGKDSLVMLETLASSSLHIPFTFEITACHVIAQGVGYQIDEGYLARFCENLGIRLIFENIEIDLSKNNKKHPCFVCSWHRRKKLFEVCRRLQCNKLAFGHHKDDAIETFLKNMVFHASLSSLPQTVELFNGEITLIRPLLNIPENEIQLFADCQGYKKELKQCRFEEKNTRNQIQNLLKDIEKMYPKAKQNIFKSMDNAYPEYLPKSKKPH